LHDQAVEVATHGVDLWAALGSLGSLGAAVFAGLQIYWSRTDANRRAALEQFRAIDERLQVFIRFGARLDAIHDNIVQRYRGQAVDLSDGALAYLSLLNAIEDCAHAIAEGIVDRRMAIRHLQTVVRPEVVPLTFVSELQRSCKDPNVYEGVRRLLGDVLKLRG
jgi:hypothetical protein